MIKSFKCPGKTELVFKFLYEGINVSILIYQLFSIYSEPEFASAFCEKN